MSKIRILEKESNQRGDLFCRLMTDLFIALGYEQIRLNIHKSGREIDLEANHRTESRLLIAECKATKNQIGGDDINKFIGVLDAERHKNSKIPIIGYYISLSGYTETAIEQERDAGGKRLILLDGYSVIMELIKGRIIIPQAKATERAGRCAANQSKTLKLDSPFEIVAHKLGLIWVIYFSLNKKRTHFSLIHADGEAIDPSIAEIIVASDKSLGGSLHTLSYLPPLTDKSILEKDISQVKQKYFKYLSEECGFITLEGLPADQEVGSQRLRLENIFLPLFLEPLKIREQKFFRENSEELYPSDFEDQRSFKTDRVSIGKILAQNSHIALLAAPGGGKTTLLKRLAIAYAFPERRDLIADNLPSLDVIPLFIRCRQLGEMVRAPINDIIREIPKRAEIPELDKIFVHLINRSLRTGKILFLIDGLDEISEESNRISFVKQLCIFLATYPTIKIVVTSREAGFRVISAALNSLCTPYKIADLNEDDIKQLTLAWHKEVVGNKDEVHVEAEKLAGMICNSDRIKQLAKNPLLLTTLLLVKRWVGQLPTRRSILYGKAIEVLLMTWNVEGYEPIDQEEAIPQLAFIAFVMAKNGLKRISLFKLKETLRLAREQMPEILSYTRLSISEFIKRIELRSSLLILVGHEIDQGSLNPVYEFRHLTFQEYLTARAIVEGCYPDRRDDDTELKILLPHLQDENWKEIISLTAVLSGRKVQPLIKKLIELSVPQEDFEHESKTTVTPTLLLAQCIIDEIQISPNLLMIAFEKIIKNSNFMNKKEIFIQLIKCKYSDLFFNTAKEIFLNHRSNLLKAGGVIGYFIQEEINWNETHAIDQNQFRQLEKYLTSEDIFQRVCGALGVMEIAFEIKSSFYPPNEIEPNTLNINSQEKIKFIEELVSKIIPLLDVDLHYVHISACWSLAWIGKKRFWSPKRNPEVILKLINIWRNTKLDEVQYLSSWAISALPLINRDNLSFIEPDPALISFIKEQISELYIHNSTRFIGALVIAYYLRSPWTDEEISLMITENFQQLSSLEKYKLLEILDHIDVPGISSSEFLKIISEKKMRRSKSNRRGRT